MTEPLVSVVIATWNTGRYLPETLDSALSQTWPRTEIIVVDDGSTDDTAARIEPYRSRIRYLEREHGGLAAARNAGVAVAQGDYIALLDADDLWTPDKLSVQLEVAARHPDSGLIACDGVEFEGETPLRLSLLGGALGHLIHEEGAREVSGQFHRVLLDTNPIACPAQTLIPRRVLDAVGPFIDSGGQDYACYLRIAQRFPITLHRDSLVRCRYRPESMSGPREGRARKWGWMKLEVLHSHAGRCTVPERRFIARRLVPLIRSLAYYAYMGGTNGDRAGAVREIVQLLRTRPWPPTALPYLIGLLAPAPLRSGAARTKQMAKRLMRWGSVNAFGRVERRAPELDRIVPRGAIVERVAHGFGYTEGPIWMPEGYLLFGDLRHNVIRKWDPSVGASVVRTRTGYADADTPPGAGMGSNGMTLDGEGRLTICEPGNRRVTQMEEDGAITVLADRYDGKRLNSPNDVVYRSDGSLYFTDPPHGLPGEDSNPKKELAFNGLYRVAAGKIQLLSRDMTRPNGLAFSPDEKYLYVANSDPKQKIWMRYEVLPDGDIQGGSVFLDLTREPGQPPDGMKVDIQGNLYLTGPGGLWIVSASGRILGVIRTEKEPANCAWGGPDGRSLYLTACGDIYRIHLAIPGVLPYRLDPASGVG